MSTRTAAVLAASALVLSACTSSGTMGADPRISVSSPASCHRDALPTRLPGRLVIATGQPAYEPWVVDDDPASGQGFEAAVAVAVAAELGYSSEDIRWTRTTFSGAIAPGAKAFDWNLQQFSVTEDREKSVDFSSPYYASNQAIVSSRRSPIADAQRLSDLAASRLGAAIGSTSLIAAQALVDDGDVVIFDDTASAVRALRQSEVDGVVVDLPTAYQLVDAEIPHGVIVGQLQGPAGAPTDEFGILLADGSPLTACTSLAVDALRADGTLADLADQWLGAYSGAPVLAQS